MYHEKCNHDEIFIGNTLVENLVDRKKKLEGVSSLRVGYVAFDIHGEKLSPKLYKPLFINKSDAAKYNRIMMESLGRIYRRNL